MLSTGMGHQILIHVRHSTSVGSAVSEVHCPVRVAQSESEHRSAGHVQRAEEIQIVP